MWDAIAEGKPKALVLAGGGARGAYQVGALERLAESGFVPDVVAGTSIGALNGSLVAQEPDFEYATSLLRHAWTSLEEVDVIQLDLKKLATEFISTGSVPVTGLRKWLAANLFQRLTSEERTWFDPAPIEAFINEHVNPGKLRNGKAFWVAVTPMFFEQDFPFRDVFESIRASVTGDVDYVQPAQLDNDGELLDALLASAALPVVYPSRSVRDYRCLDGGIVDNVPLKALLDKKCGLAVVVHLSNGSVWSSSDIENPALEDLTVLEIRPQSPVQPSETIAGWIQSLLDFSSEAIERLSTMGRRDTNRLIEQVHQWADVTHGAHQAREELLSTTQELMDDPPIEIDD